MGFMTLNPSRGSSVGRSEAVIVSPTPASPISFIEAVMNPTCPVSSSSSSVACGANVPIFLISYFLPVAISFMLMPSLTVPSYILTSITTPWYESNQLSNMSALSLESSGVFGGGTSATIDSSISFVPVPSLALAKTACSVEIPTISSISFFTLSGSAEGRSILFITGRSSSPESAARYAWASVWASTP